MFEITYAKPNFQWSCDFIFTSYDDAKAYLENQGFVKVTNGFESNFDTSPKAYITPKKVYKAKREKLSFNKDKTSNKDPLNRYEIWCEGDEEEKAHWFGTFHATSFKDACIRMFGENSEKFNLTEMTYCERKLFSEEREARKSHG